MQPRLLVDRERLAAFCEKWKVAQLALFGSVLREDFGPESDVDVLVSFRPDAGWTLFDMVYMRDELQSIFGREVHLVSRQGLEASRNWIRRQAILASAEVVCAMGAVGGDLPVPIARI
jgi:hypothetical protein